MVTYVFVTELVKKDVVFYCCCYEVSGRNLLKREGSVKFERIGQYQRVT